MSKELFLKDRELSADWRAIATSDKFEHVLIFARSQIGLMAPSREEWRGVELLAHTLRTLASAEDEPFVFPSPGLEHQADAMPEPDKKKTTKKK